MSNAVFHAPAKMNFYNLLFVIVIYWTKRGDKRSSLSLLELACYLSIPLTAPLVQQDSHVAAPISTPALSR